MEKNGVTTVRISGEMCKMEVTNGSFFDRNVGFCGNLCDWFEKHVRPTDLFRVWFKDSPDDTCDFYHIVNIITAGSDTFLGMVSPDCEDNPIYWYRLSEISSFAILPDEGV